MNGIFNLSKIKNRGFIKFTLSGGGVLLFTLIVTYILTKVFYLHYLLSYLIVLTTVTVINYFLAVKFIFLTKDKHPKRLFYYILGLGLFYVGDLELTKFLTEVMNFFYLISIFFSRVIFFLTKYFYYKKILFNDRSILYLKK